MDSSVKLSNAVYNLCEETIIELAIDIWYKDYIPDISVYRDGEFIMAASIIFLLSMFSICSRDVARAIQSSIGDRSELIYKEFDSELSQALLPYQSRHYAYKHYNKTIEQ